MQPTGKNTYTIPTSAEVLAHEQQQLYEAALEAATPTHEINPDDFDPRRIEGIEGIGAGATKLAAATAQEAAIPSAGEMQVDPMQILNVGTGTQRMREYAIAHLTREDVGLGA